MRTSRSNQEEQLGIIGAMLAEPLAWHPGLAAAAAAGLAPGTGYPALARAERAGWLESRWEEAPAGAPRRRLYRLTGLGQRVALEVAPIPSGRRRRPRFGLAIPQGQPG
jgi:PadR family transcriptional regulator PadR